MTKSSSESGDHLLDAKMSKLPSLRKILRPIRYREADNAGYDRLLVKQSDRVDIVAVDVGVIQVPPLRKGADHATSVFGIWSGKGTNLLGSRYHVDDTGRIRRWAMQ